eukprot:GFUD01135141.1.p1 GENE.GFUD01135141.1~~GFUD01135141.1.p1  ORF type:complete len:1023 (+),score=387.68 GFUD01135141.1:121-3189(+)
MKTCSHLLVVGLALIGLDVTLGVSVMSVDIGAEWMKVAVVSPGVPMEIALNPESKRKTSTAVSIKDGERKFGSDAMVVCVKSPKHCYVYLLDLLGKKVDHPIVTAYKERFPQYTIESDPERGTVVFRHDEETAYSVEELIGMMLAHAKTQAESFTEQTVKDVVITTPVYFNQAERMALLAAAQLGGLNVLQLMNNPVAVALNYGMFRRKEINGTVKNLMLYDMGAQATTATIVGFQVVKTKEKGFSETHPQAQILGVGFDRSLGGADIKFRLREYLADQFNALGKTKTNVRTVPRAMGKLLKEAERVKLILSANTDCYAQIENVMEDIDFKVPMSRDKLMELSKDLMDRVTGPVERALTTATMGIDNIDQVILVGGGTRVPRVQELLAEYVGQELGKSLNTDESAAMGAVYRSADISTGFKVKKFLTKDAVLFPIDVDFAREIDTEEPAVEPGYKKVRRTLFSRMNPYPQKKIMTFNKHVKDFTFNVNYADLDYLGETEVANIGSPNLTSVLVKGVKGALDANVGDDIETKGVKAHFLLDDSGILTVTHVESVFEKTISPEEQEKKEKEWKEATDSIDWSKLGDNIKSFFGTDGKKAEDGDEIKEESKEEEEVKKDSKDSKDTKKDDKSKKDDKEKPKEPKKPKIETVKVDLEVDGSRNDLELLDGASFNSSKSKLDSLNQADLDRLAIETALNELQSFSYDLSDKIEEDEFQVASTVEERDAVINECSKVSEWLDDEAGLFTPVDEFNTKLKVLKDLSAPVMARVREHKERPETLEMLRQTINSSNVFLEKSKQYLIQPKPKVETVEPEIGEADKKDESAGEAKDDKQNPEGKKKATEQDKTGDDGLFKEKELESLRKKIVEVEKWRDNKLEEQEKTPLSEMPKLTVSMIKSKIQDLDSEVQFLIQKARMMKAEKERAKRKAEAEEKKAEEERLKKEKKAKKKKAKEANATNSEGETIPEVPSEDVPPTDSTGEGDTSSDTTDKKPEPEIIEEVFENSKDTRDDAEKPSDDKVSEDEHTEL